MFIKYLKFAIIAVVLLLLGFLLLLTQKQNDDNNEIQVSPTLTVEDSNISNHKKTVGTIICLPHKDTSGPVTLECALGLQAEDGNYGLNTGQIQSNGLPIFDTGDNVEVSGQFIDVEELEEDDRLRIYDIRGIINVESLSKTENEL